MADQAFSNAGLSMFGQDAAIARQMSTPDSAQEKMAKAASASGGGGGGAGPLAMLANKALESLSSAFPDASKQISSIQGAIMPQPTAAVGQSGIAPVAPSASPIGVSPVSPQAPTTSTPQTTTGGYRSFFNVPSFGTNP